MSGMFTTPTTNNQTSTHTHTIGKEFQQREVISIQTRDGKTHFIASESIADSLTKALDAINKLDVIMEVDATNHETIKNYTNGAIVIDSMINRLKLHNLYHLIDNSSSLNTVEKIIAEELLNAILKKTPPYWQRFLYLRPR